MKRKYLVILLIMTFFISSLSVPVIVNARQEFPCMDRITSADALLVADPYGQILYKKNEAKKKIPASTLKLLTALTAIHHLGNDYRFKTEFYVDHDKNIKIKGYGDPLLISEIWQEIADDLSKKVQVFRDLILDDTYFSPHLVIPRVGRSTNPYDAPVGALCANFNTIFFDRDKQGRIISAEPQTPIIPYASEKIRSLRLERGRYAFTHDHRDSARYAGELLLHFLRKSGLENQGKIRLGAVGPQDRLILTYRSRFTLEQGLRKMMEFSNNFIANQIFIALGAQVHGPPATLGKAVSVVSDFAKKELKLKEIEVVEGSGISRENRLSALDMLIILKHFKPHRYLLNREDNILYKTGSLKGIRTRAGYIERGNLEPYYFAIFINGSEPNIESLMECIKRVLSHPRKGS